MTNIMSFLNSHKTEIITGCAIVGVAGAYLSGKVDALTAIMEVAGLLGIGMTPHTVQAQADRKAMLAKKAATGHF